MDTDGAVMPPEEFCEPRISPRFAVIDEIAIQIVREMLRRDLRAGQIVARMSHWGDYDVHFFAVREITGPGWRIVFGRNQGRIGSNGRVGECCTGISRVVAEGLDVSLYADGVSERPDDWAQLQIARRLRREMLQEIMRYPVVLGALERLTNPPPIAYPENLPALLTACDQVSVETFALNRRHGELVVRRSDMRTLQCVFEPYESEVTLASLDQRLFTRPTTFQTRLIRIRPLWANGLAVVETADCREAMQRKDRGMTLGVLDDLLGAMLDGAVSPASYDGTFREPLVLVRRHLSPLEVEPAGGPWPALKEFRFSTLPMVAGQMLRESRPEFEQAVAARVAYKRLPDPPDSMWQTVIDAAAALAEGLRRSRRLVQPFVRFQRCRMYAGEPARLRDFALVYTRWAADAQLRSERGVLLFALGVGRQRFAAVLRRFGG